MNEKIANLIKESDLEECIDDAYLMRDDWQPFIEKFAELIVRECISVMKSTVDESIDFERKLDETSSWIEGDIKKHFGVEL